jgi:peptidoglycan/LPS O-acetylase OafA/YrhL
VQAFFIISGFYMTLVLGGKYADTRLFYTNRMLRIFPSYLVMLAIAAVIFLRPWRKRHRDTEHVPARLPGSNRGSGHGV